MTLALEDSNIELSDVNDGRQPDVESDEAESSSSMQLLVEEIEDQAHGYFWPENHQ